MYMEKLLIQIESCRKDHERRDNTFTESVLTSAYNKLKEYYDLEEQGLLLRLPCKVGDTVYKIWRSNKNNIPYRIHEEKINDLVHLVAMVENGSWGKTAFLTREEAEKALEKMKGDSCNG